MRRVTDACEDGDAHADQYGIEIYRQFHGVGGQEIRPEDRHEFAAAQQHGHEDHRVEDVMAAEARQGSHGPLHQFAMAESGERRVGEEQHGDRHAGGETEKGNHAPAITGRPGKGKRKPLGAAARLRHGGPVKPAILVLVLLLAAIGIAYRFAPLESFDALMPKDAGSRQVEDGLRYGEGPRRKLDLYAPVTPGSDRPVIVWFYGGSWNSGARQHYAFAARGLAAQGFVVAVPDYRLVPEARFPAFVEDGAAAVRWVRANIAEYGGDPDRIVVMGHSAGAYIAAMLASDPQWLGDDRAAVVGLVGLAGPYDFAPFDVDSTKAAFGEWPDAAQTQPVTFAGAGSPPALLLTGADDTTVKPRNSHALTQRLHDAGVEAEVIEYPGVGHIGILTALARPLRARTPVLRDATGFARDVTAR